MASDPMTDPTEAVRRYLAEFSDASDDACVDETPGTMSGITFGTLRALLAAHDAAVAEVARLRESSGKAIALMAEAQKSLHWFSTPTDQRSV